MSAAPFYKYILSLWFLSAIQTTMPAEPSLQQPQFLIFNGIPSKHVTCGYQSHQEKAHRKQWLVFKQQKPNFTHPSSHKSTAKKELLPPPVCWKFHFQEATFPSVTDSILSSACWCPVCFQHWNKDIHTHNSTVHNGQKVEAAHMSVNRWMSKQIHCVQMTRRY